jgi:hypothetical protein
VPGSSRPLITLRTTLPAGFSDWVKRRALAAT